jgi:microcystin-dependent protein
MSVPTSISQLNTTASLNSPAGTEPIGNSLAPYLNAAFAFIAQLANGSGLTQAQALNMNNYKINNVAPATAGTDAVNLNQLSAYLPVGTILMYSGAVANIASAYGTKWALCNGQNGTPNLMDKFVIGAGNNYAPGSTGGATSYTLSVANMPIHSHGVNDPGHNHGVNDPGHNHGVNDPGHSHTLTMGALIQSGGSTECYVPSDLYGKPNAHTETTNGSGTGIWLNASGTGIWLNGSGTGVSIQNSGSGQAMNIIPPYYALCYVMKISN